MSPDADSGGVVDAFELRLVPFAQPTELTGPLARVHQVRTCSSISDDHSASAAAGMRYSARSRPRVAARFEHLQAAIGRRGPDAGQQLQDAKAGDAIARIVRPAQQREHILHVRGFEKLQAAVFHVRNVAAEQLELEHVAVMRSCAPARPAVRNSVPCSRAASICSTT